MSQTNTPRDDESPSDSVASGASDSFERALRQLARPPSVGPALEQEVRLHHPELVEDDAWLRATRTSAAERALPRPGTMIEHYRILSLLGQGGMGAVFAAENVRTGKEVAIKWILLDGTDDGRRSVLVARFYREARAVAKVDHPNVVAVYDVGDAAGTPFLVMERLQGESLRARLERGALDWPDALALMREVLRGVAAVHRAGVVHRDLKPDNIFLAHVNGDAAVVPKVLDFGVAATRERLPADLGSLTRTGAIVGTPSYMPFEQLTGAAVDERADIYALGTVCYELLTRQLPFSSRSATELAVLQATTVPTRPSRYVRALRGRRERVLLKALAKEPSRRFASVDDFARALDACDRVAPAQRALSGLALGLLLTCAAWFALGTRPQATQPVTTRVESAPAPVAAPLPSLQAGPAAAMQGSTQAATALDENPPASDAGSFAKPRRANRSATVPEVHRAPAAEPPPSRPADPTAIGVDDF